MPSNQVSVCRASHHVHPTSDLSLALNKTDSSHIKQMNKRRERHVKETHSYASVNFPISEAKASTSEDDFLRMNRYEYKSITSQPSIKKSSLLGTARNNSNCSRLRLISCPCHACQCSLDASDLLGHYIRDHQHGMGLPFVELGPENKASMSCHVRSLEHDVNTLLGVFGYRRPGLNPLKCARNTHLPSEYRKYSQHGVLMVFGCRTQHSLLWHRKPDIDDVLVIWVTTPLQNASVSLRLLVQAGPSLSYYKTVKARPASATQDCKEFIKTDSNAMLMGVDDLRGLMDLDVWQQLLKVELKLLGKQKI